MGNIQSDSKSNNKNDNQRVNINAGNKKELKNKYCNKCGRKLESELYGLFCDSYCRSEYYLEIRQDMDDCFGAWSGRD